MVKHNAKETRESYFFQTKSNHEKNLPWLKMKKMYWYQTLRFILDF